MDGVMNERTNTVHRRAGEKERLQSVCGVTTNLSQEQLHPVEIERASEHEGGEKCGSCFVDGRSY